MLTHEDIHNKAERKYVQVLRDWLKNENSLFPLKFPIGKPPVDLTERSRVFADLREKSSEVLPNGYDLEWETLNTRDLGRQTIPRVAVLRDCNHYLSYLRKRTEFDAFVGDVDLIRRRLPALEGWLDENTQMVIRYHGVWTDLLTVCHYFIQQPKPNVYLRELPIEVHTKFIESHFSILRSLLDALLPVDVYNTPHSDFILRYGLKDKPSLVRLRLLDEQLEWKYNLQLDDLTLPLKQAAHLLAEHLQPRRVIIVENLINFLTLPRLPNSVGIFGGGFAVYQLRELDWLQKVDLLYWGDMDIQGFQILNDLRRIFPHTRSIMMDQVTFDRYRLYTVKGTASRSLTLEHLTPEEQALARVVAWENIRLEQEHLPQGYVIETFKHNILG
ncbi:MAG: Wadjet anti-phage system protein JetD domain-containing protein [Phototrophicaceae bacterium]